MQSHPPTDLSFIAKQRVLWRSWIGPLRWLVPAGYRRDGGDGLTVFKQGRHREPGVADIEATLAYLKTHNPIAPQANKRVQRLN